RQAILDQGSNELNADGTLSLRSLIRPNASDLIIYELKPDLSVQFQKVTVTTNSFGMRGPEVSLVKPPDTFRLAVLGDSYAFGWGVEDDQVFSRVLEQKLEGRLPGGKHPQVLNFGVPGYSTFQETAQFLESGSRFSPDAVLVYFIYNDFA